MGGGGGGGGESTDNIVITRYCIDMIAIVHLLFCVSVAMKHMDIDRMQSYTHWNYESRDCIECMKYYTYACCDRV